MAVPVPHTFTAGDNATSAVMQTLTDSALWNLGSTTSTGARQPLTRLRQTIAQSPATATWTAVTFDTEDVDYDSGHSTTINPSRYTAVTAGWYSVSAVLWFTGNATGGRFGALAVNGSGGASLTGGISGSEVGHATVPNSGNLSIPIPEQLVHLNASDYVELYAFQNSGGALATIVSGLTQPCLNITWISN